MLASRPVRGFNAVMSRAAETYLEPQIFELGKGTVAVVRHRGGGRVEAGIFLVDTYCLGAKDPDADPDSVDRILGHLRKRCGKDGFHFLVAADFLNEEDAYGDDDEVDEPPYWISSSLEWDNGGECPGADALIQTVLEEYAQVKQVAAGDCGSESCAAMLLDTALDMTRKLDPPLSRSLLIQGVEASILIWNVATLPAADREAYLAGEHPDLRDPVRKMLAAEDSKILDMVKEERFRVIDWKLLGEDGPDGAIVEPHLLIVAAGWDAEVEPDSEGHGDEHF